MAEPSDDLLRTLAGEHPPKTARAVDNQPLARGRVRDTFPALGGDAASVLVRRVVLPPGATTGWHYHPGPLLVVVNQGVLTHTLAQDLSTETVSAGQVFVEAPGAENAHIGNNLGTVDLVLYAVYFLPSADSPLARQAAAPRAATASPDEPSFARETH